MRLIFHGRTALAVLMSTERLDRAPANAESVLRGCTPTAASLAYAFAQYPQLPAPLHLLMDRWNAPGNQPSFIARRCGSALPGSAFMHASNGLYVASPELCLAQIG